MTRRLGLRYGIAFGSIFFVLFSLGHIFVMPLLAKAVPLFERWNYSPTETLIRGAITALLAGLVLAPWKPTQ